MNTTKRSTQRLILMGAVCLLPGIALVLSTVSTCDLKAGPLLHGHWGKKDCDQGCCAETEGPPTDDLGGTWYWLRSPEEEKRVVASLYNRYCIRCHGVDGRGVWDIPGIPDFTSTRWQACRSDAQRARIILEGRGAVMPPFRGVLTLEEAYAIGRYLRTFVPGTEVTRPDLSKPMPPAEPQALVKPADQPQPLQLPAQ